MFTLYVIIQKMQKALKYSVLVLSPSN